MKPNKILALLFLALFSIAAAPARSQQPEQPADRRHFDIDDRRSMHDWYSLHHNKLPRGLQRKDRLPSDLEKQLVVHETLSATLRARVIPAPPDFLIHVPPPPPDCQYVFLGGHAVLMDAKTFYVWDVFHFEKKLK